MHYVASVSFGKDSLAMLLLLLEKRYPLDEVVFYDTGKEFQAIYNLEQKIKPMLEHLGIKYTRLEPKLSFDYKMFEKPVCKRGTNEVHKYGYLWCGGTCRWGTTDKLQHIKCYLSQYGDYKEYVGIAADETERLLKEREDTKLFPLAEWGMTEQDCLQACYERGYHWYEQTSNGVIELYDILDRVSCWCCRNKNLKELKGIYDYLPEYWEKLRGMQSKLKEPMKGEGKDIFNLEKWFRVGCCNKREYKKYLKQTP